MALRAEDGSCLTTKQAKAVNERPISSGEPTEVGPGFWEEKHRRLDARLKKTGTV